MVLERLAESQHRPALVVTRPDARRGRGQKLSPPPVADARARARHRASSSPRDLHAPDVLDARSPRPQPEALVVCAYGVLIKEPLLSDYEILNVHPSLLPRWRGAAPVERAIMAGDAETGVVDHAAHRGPRLRAGLPRGARADPARRRLRVARRRGSRGVGGEALVRALDERPPFVEQDEARRDLRAQDRGARPRARPDAAARGGRAGRAGAAAAHRRAAAAPGRVVPRRGRAPRSTARRWRRPAATCAPTATGCCSTATAARSS